MTYTDQKLGKTKQKVHMLIDPEYMIDPQSGEVATDTINKYIEELMKKNPANIEELIELDAEGIEIDGQHIAGMLLDVKDAADVTASAFDASATTI